VRWHPSARNQCARYEKKTENTEKKRSGNTPVVVFDYSSSALPNEISEKTTTSQCPVNQIFDQLEKLLFRHHDSFSGFGFLALRRIDNALQRKDIGNKVVNLHSTRNVAAGVENWATGGAQN